eukprot:GHUV01028955.1.p1 GENE.GHUV01028955.1~~GHUV01028955.1.p1  ORF type:complete len:145 (+),score=29.26 GHUV01028955.1:2-436(+)
MPFPATDTATDLCLSTCEDNPVRVGSFEWTRAVPLDTLWQVQQHIRAWGAVVTSFNIFPDFRPFFERNAKGVYERNVTNTSATDRGGEFIAHAVVVVGYNNKEDYIVCKNSWGPDWGDEGFFKVNDTWQTSGGVLIASLSSSAV